MGQIPPSRKTHLAITLNFKKNIVNLLDKITKNHKAYENPSKYIGTSINAPTLGDHYNHGNKNGNDFHVCIQTLF